MGVKTFSIIVPVYNTERYINECIDSIVHSTCKDWELILIDDGSTDGSGTICDMWCMHDDSRIRVYHQNNRGVSATRNFGIEQATGEWLVFVDSDDTISSYMLQRIFETAYNRNSDLIFTDFHIVSQDRTEIFRTYPWSDDKDKSFQNYLTRSWPRVAWGAVRKNLVTDNNIRYPENLTSFEDFHFMCNCILHSRKITRIGEPLYNYRVSNALSITHTITTQRKKADEIWVYEDLFRILKVMGKYALYAPFIYWRILRNKQSMITEISLHDEFLSFLPEKRKYILSCPMLSFRMKLMMWCLSHHLRFIPKLAFLIKKGLKNA